jgi:hypothetical protein
VNRLLELKRFELSVDLDAAIAAIWNSVFESYLLSADKQLIANFTFRTT